MRFRVFTALILVFSSIGFTANVIAQSKELRSATDRVNGSAEVLTEIMRTEDKSIPGDLLAKAKAIVVFPGAIKGGFIIGGQGGKGLAVRRAGNGWSAPAFMNMAGGSFGLQIGAEKTDYILLIMNDKGLRELLEDKFEVGAEGSVAAGPVGRTAAASTNATMDAEILTYSRSKGVFAGLSLKGVVISPDQDINSSIYHKPARDILGDPPVPASAAPAQLQRFSTTVAGYAR